MQVHKPSRSHISGFDVIFGSPYGLAASPYAGAVSHVLWYFPYVFVAPPCDSAASHAGHIPIGFAAPPYGHTPDAFPHTFWQIPIGRPFSHTPHQIPIGRPSPHTIHIIDKPAGFHFDETSGSSSTNPNQPRQADIQNLRYNPANQKPTGSSKSHGYSLHKSSAGQVQQITHACDWGVAPAPPARVCAYIYGHGHARIFISMRTHSRARHRHSCAHQSPGAFSDETSGSGSRGSSANPIHSNALKLRYISADLQSNRPTQKPWGAWARRRPATRRRRSGSPPARFKRAHGSGLKPDTRPARRPAPAAQARGSPGSRGRPDPAKARRRGAGSRRTDDGSRRPPARPGVTLAPGFAVSTSLPYHVFLEASR